MGSPKIVEEIFGEKEELCIGSSSDETLEQKPKHHSDVGPSSSG